MGKTQKLYVYTLLDLFDVCCLRFIRCLLSTGLSSTSNSQWHWETTLTVFGPHDERFKHTQATCERQVVLKNRRNVRTKHIAPCTDFTSQQWAGSSMISQFRIMLVGHFHFILFIECVLQFIRHFILWYLTSTSCFALSVCFTRLSDTLQVYVL